MDAECARREANGYRAQGMENCAALSERNAEMLEALADAAEKWLAVTPKWPGRFGAGSAKRIGIDQMHTDARKRARGAKERKIEGVRK